MINLINSFYRQPLYGNLRYYFYLREYGSVLEKVTLSNKLKHIGEQAFCYSNNLEEIENLDSLTSMAEDTFYIFAGTKWYEEWYDNLPDGDIYIGNVYYGYKGEMPENTTITIKDGTISIAGSAFSGCTNLTGITIPDSVTSIGERAFYGCTNLTNIMMSDNITSIGADTFRETAWLNNQPDGSIYIGNIYYGYKGERPNTIEIKEGTTVIGSEAFYNNTGLTEIIIPSSVKRIEEGAFAACTSLTNVTFENGLISIGDCAFNECSNLTSITIPNSVQDIGNSAFSGCYNLGNIVISDNVKKIGHYSFAGCPIMNIVIPEGVISIGTHAFYMCEYLTFLQMPNTVMTIDSRAFSNCNNLTTVNYTGTEEEWEKINIHIVENDNLKNATINYNTTIGTYVEFMDDFLKNKSEEELEELTLKSAGYLGTFEQYLSEGEITKADLEQIASQQNMTYVEYLKDNLKVYGQNWLYVEYLAYAQGEQNKTLEELRDVAVNGWGYESFEQFLGTEGMTMDDWQNVVKDNGFRSERDYLKCIVYASML